MPLLVLAVAASLSSSAQAQGFAVLTGTVVDAATHKPVADALVTATSPALQGEQMVVTDDRGFYRLPSLPPGLYALRFEKETYKPLARGEIALRLDRTYEVDVELLPEALAAEEIVVVARAPTIDVGSAASGVDVTPEMLSLLPMVRPGSLNSAARSFESLAELAPGARSDTFGVSIAGTTSPETQYVVDGLSVNNPAYGILGTPLSMEFVKEVSVITGGYLPEYGRATGGIVHALTKSGSSEYHGSVFGSASLGFFESASSKVRTEGNVISTDSTLESLGSLGFEIGGPVHPLLKDKLWFYGGFVPSMTRFGVARSLNRVVYDDQGNPLTDDSGFTTTEELAGTRKDYVAEMRTYQYLAKLTWQVSSNHSLTLSAYGSPATNGGNGKFGFNPASGEIETGPTSSIEGSQGVAGEYGVFAHRYEASSNDVSALWSSAFWDKRLLLDVKAGWHHQSYSRLPSDGSTLGGDEGLAGTPTVIWRDPRSVLDYESIPDASLCDSTARCPVSMYLSGGPDWIYDGTLDRVQGRIGGTLLLNALGHHVIKAGLDLEAMRWRNDKAYSGGVRYWELTSEEAAAWGLPEGSYFLSGREYGFLTGPDQYVVQKHLVVHSTSQELGLYLQDSWSIADRVTLNLGARYDSQYLYGDSDQLAVAFPYEISPRVGLVVDPLRLVGSNLAGRAKLFGNYARYYESIPLNVVDRSFPGEGLLFSLHEGKSAQNPAGCDLKDPAQARACRDQRMGGFTYPWDPNQQGELSGGTSMPADPDIKPQSSDELVFGAEYELMRDGKLSLNYTHRWINHVVEDMSRDEGTTYFLGNPGYGMARDFPKAERDYDAVTLAFTKSFAQSWLAHASYTWSKLRGNYPGLVRPEGNQLDPNFTSEFDLLSLLDNRDGPLPGDRTHAITVLGAKELRFGSVSLNGGVGYRGYSGAPISYLGAHPSYGANQTYILPRGSAGRTPWLHNVDAKLSVTYRMTQQTSLTIDLDCFNVFNFQSAASVDNAYTYASVSPLKPGSSLADLQTVEGTPLSEDQLNKNFMKPTAYQAPRIFRLGMRMSF
ncbi:MAG: TonB-dependent receptor [Deltaproteobacteria bacterium]|nr:TonB-dependent receptor [Deltaproteobacteria bacterium]